MIDVREIAACAAPKLAGGIEECWMELDGAQMRYLRAGSGPPLILLHGLLGYSFSWRFTMPTLAQHFQVFAPDLLGAGFSERPAIDHSMKATARRVLQFAENLGLTSFDLLGTSRGGAVAMCVAAEGANRTGSTLGIRRLVLACPVNPYCAHGKLLAPFFATRFGAAGFRWTVERFPRLFPYFHGRLYANPEKIPAGSLDGYKAPLAFPGLFEHGLSIVKSWTVDLLELEKLMPKLHSIPTLLIWGGKDTAVYVSSLAPLARNFRKVETVVFPGVGHLPYEECPDEFNRELIRFLKQGTGD